MISAADLRVTQLKTELAEAQAALAGLRMSILFAATLTLLATGPLRGLAAWLELEARKT